MYGYKELQDGYYTERYGKSNPFALPTKQKA